VRLRAKISLMAKRKRERAMTVRGKWRKQWRSSVIRKGDTPGLQTGARAEQEGRVGQKTR